MTRQTSFGGGELAPLFHGRQDLPLYARAAKTMRNYFASKHGAAVSRPGTQFVNTTKNPNDTQVRLLPFIFSDSQSYVLELGYTNGAGYIRFHTNGGTVENPILGTAYEKTTLYTVNHLRGIKHMQVGDVMTLTRIGYAAMELRRLPDWDLASLQALQVKAIAEADVARFNAVFSSLSIPGTEKPAFRRIFIAQDEAAAEAAASAFGDTSYNNWIALHPLDEQGAMDAYRIAYYNAFEAALFDGAAGAPHWTFLPVQFERPASYFGGAAGSYPCVDSAHLTAEDATHPDQVWMYAVTLSAKDRETGRQFETKPYFVTDSWDHNVANLPIVLGDNLHSVYPDRHLILYRGAHKDRASANAPAVNQSFQELGWNIYKGHDRRVMGLIGTATGDTFVDVGIEPDYATQPPLGTNPFLTYDYAGALAQTENPAACCIFQDRKLFGGTHLRPTAVFASATGDYNNFDLHDLVHSAGESLLFELAALRGEKIVHLVSHRAALIATESNWRYLRGSGGPLDYNSVESDIIEAVGAKDVTPLVIDGEVLYVRTKGAGARALRTDNGGNFRGVDLSTHADHLMRGAGTFFPTLGTRKDIVEWTYAEDPWGLVWAVRDDGMLLSLQYQGGEAGWSWHDSYTANDVPGIFKSVCAVPETGEDAVYVAVKRALAVALPVASGGSATSFIPAPNGFALCIERMRSRERNGDAEDDGAVDCGLRFEGPPTTTIGDLDHLAGENVWFVATGNPPMGPLLVSAAGEITLPDMPVANDGANVIGFIGLQFTPDLELLPVRGARTAKKGAFRVGLDLEQSSGIKVGPDFEGGLIETRPHNVASSGYVQPEPTSEFLTASIPNKYDYDARVCIRQSLPLPVTIVAVERDVDVGGK